MIEVKVNDAALRTAAAEGEDAFVEVFIDAINAAIGGTLTEENMQELNSDQITLLGWSYLHGEVMNGGYVQLIYNGYGAFIFKNPFGVAMRDWGLTNLYSHLRRTRKAYDKYHEQIEKENVGRDFMALYEQMPEFDEADDDFVLNEEEWTKMVAAYIDDHINNFATIENE